MFRFELLQIETFYIFPTIHRCMPIRAREGVISAWVFLLGVILALAGGIVLSFGYSVNPIILGILAILGLISGFFVQVQENNGTRFLMVVVSLVLVSFAGQQGTSTVSFGDLAIGTIIAYTLTGLLILLVPATIVVAIRTLFSLSRL